MADYEINTTSFTVTQSDGEDYSVGLNYEAPSKGIQYQNLILDDISSQFDGTQTVFSLSDSGDSYNALNDQQLIVSVANQILSPGVDYTVSGSEIVFATPPASGSPFFTVALANTADLTRSGFVNGDISTVMSPRTIITWAENYLLFEDIEYSFKLSFLNRCDELERSVIEEYFQRSFGIDISDSKVANARE